MIIIYSPDGKSLNRMVEVAQKLEPIFLILADSVDIIKSVISDQPKAIFLNLDSDHNGCIKFIKTLKYVSPRTALIGFVSQKEFEPEGFFKELGVKRIISNAFNCDEAADKISIFC